MNKRYRQRDGFTMVEISVAVGVVCILTAILLPVIGHARQSSRQTNCASNLQQIYLATRQYYEDQRAYPSSTALLMPTLTTTTTTTVTTNGGDAPEGPTRPEAIQLSAPVITQPTPGATTTTVTTTNTTPQYGYIKDLNILRCPSDTIQTVGFTSSYDSPATNAVWDFKGYETNGYAIAASTLPPAALLVNSALAYNEKANPVRFSLSNRFAPSSTIITHCIYHRTTSSQNDIVLRLDGTAKFTDVSGFAGTPNKWQAQDQ